MAVDDGLAEHRHLERKIGAAHARAFDRLDLHHAGAELDLARFQAIDLGLVPPGGALAGIPEAAAAAGQRQQQQQTRQAEIKTHATRHARKNAGLFFNEASTLTPCEFVKDKKSLPVLRRRATAFYSKNTESRRHTAYIAAKGEMAIQVTGDTETLATMTHAKKTALAGALLAVLAASACLAPAHAAADPNAVGPERAAALHDCNIKANVLRHVSLGRLAHLRLRHLHGRTSQTE